MIAPAVTDVPAPQLRTALESDWACIWLNLDGELVAPTVPVFERALREAIALERRKIVLLAMGLSDADAAGLAAIDRAKEMARARGIKLAVRATRPAQARLPRRALNRLPALAAVIRRPEPMGALRLFGTD